MATIKEVAKRAGVAISTVSAAINRSAPVSADVLARVQKAIDEIGYVPHGAAQSLRSGQSRIIGLIVPNVINPYFAATARVIENTCLSAGYMSVVYSTGQDEDREAQILEMMQRQRVDGLVIIPTQSSAEHGTRLRAMIHVPTVLLSMPVHGLPFDVVKMDNVKAAQLATEHLLDLGHRRIAYMGGLPGLVTAEDRLDGFRAAFSARGLESDARLEMIGDFEEEAARQLSLELFAHDDRPTAIVSASNMMTLGIMQALLKLQIPVPEEVSIVGIDDFPFAEIMSTPPTVVTVPPEQMAIYAIKALMEELATKSKPTGDWKVFNPYLIPRASTAAPAD